MTAWDDANTTPECPVFNALSNACTQAESFARSMRKLRMSMRHCPQCVQFDHCPVMQQFRQSITTVLEEITQEWDLKG